MPNFDLLFNLKGILLSFKFNFLYLYGWMDKKMKFIGHAILTKNYNHRDSIFQVEHASTPKIMKASQDKIMEAVEDEDSREVRIR